MDSVLSPAGKVAAAMPGTLHELSERTGYPPTEVMRQISNLRGVERKRVNALMGERVLDDDGRPSFEPTIFVLDVSSGKE
jgi:hypothetical protein